MPTVLVKWLLNLLVAVVLFRLVRRWTRPRPAARPGGTTGRTRGRRLDPDRAVRASWSEVSDERGGDGTG